MFEHTIFKSFVFCCVVLLGVDGRRFRAHDHVGIVANTVGPFNNPTETYPVELFLNTYQILSQLSISSFEISTTRYRFAPERESNEEDTNKTWEKFCQDRGK